MGDSILAVLLFVIGSFILSHLIARFFRLLTSSIEDDFRKSVREICDVSEDIGRLKEQARTQELVQEPKESENEEMELLKHECQECGNDSLYVVEIEGINLCEECLKEAIELIENARNPKEEKKP